MRVGWAPWFAHERYSDEETQSWVRYPEAEQWRAGFLEPRCACSTPR